MSVVDCGVPLGVSILSFNGRQLDGHANLYWTTSKETEPVQFEIEKSADGISFTKIGWMKGLGLTSETNRYSFSDSLFSTKSFYRISLVNNGGKKTYSRIIQLHNSDEFSVSNVSSYFLSGISLDVTVNHNSKIDLTLLNSFGNLIKSTSVTAYTGTNNFVIPQLSSLAPGIYILQVRNNEKIMTAKTIKK